MTIVTINNEDIFYVRHSVSAGPPVIFIHGAGGTHQRWLPVVKALTNCTAYALDLPAHGQSTGVGRERIAPYADVVHGFLDAMRLSSAVIAGHSMGGAIALWLALHRPARVRGLILSGTGARLRVHSSILQAAKEGRPISLSVLEGDPATAQPQAAPREVQPTTDPVVVYGDWVACDTFDVMDRIPEISCPTLVIVGANDVMTPLKYAKYMADRIKGAKLVTIEGAGHSLRLEKPDEVTKAIQEFLNAMR